MGVKFYVIKTCRTMTKWLHAFLILAKKSELHVSAFQFPGIEPPLPTR